MLKGGTTRARTLTLAFGPQHPAAHGILKFNCLLQGETVRTIDTQFGYLHRGTEKLMEQRTVLQNLPYFDRFDYVANLQQEHAFCLAVEALAAQRLFIDLASLSLRTLFDEVSRVLNHLLTLSATALDMGAMGPIFWAFEEREVLMGLLEQASGARMHTALYRPFVVEKSGLTSLFFRELSFFLSRAVRSLAGAFCGLLANRSLKSRLAHVGQLSHSRASAYGIGGLIGRSAGLLVDGRLYSTPGYGVYPCLSFQTYLGRRGDNYDRFLLRVKEVIESFHLISQAASALVPSASNALFGSSRLHRVPSAAHSPNDGRGALCFHGHRPEATLWCGASSAFSQRPTPASKLRFGSMEALISHFRVVSEGVATLPGLVYRSVESPKGEVGVFVVSGGQSRPTRVKLRTPVAHNMNALSSVSVDAQMGDFVMTFCSFDIVLGEIDR